MTWSPEECEAYWPTDPAVPTVEYEEPPELGRLYAPTGDLISVVRAEPIPFGFQPGDTP